MVSYSDIILLLGGVGDDDRPFVPDGFNGMIPAIGSVNDFYECYYCGNATRIRPGYCRKCNGSAFCHISPRRFRVQPIRGQL